MDPSTTDDGRTPSTGDATVEASARPTGQPVQVFIVDDHALVREGTIQLLQHAPDLNVAGQAGSGEEALVVLETLSPDVALVDVNLPGMSGLELARLMLASHPDLRILIVSAYDEYAFVAEAIEIGVGGYLLKTASAKELVDAVRAVAEGVFVLDREVSMRLARRSRKDTTAPKLLTPRESDVLDLLALGRSNKQIANEMGLGIRTVEGHVSSVLAKLGVQSRTEAVAFALGNRLVNPPPHDRPRHTS